VNVDGGFYTDLRIRRALSTSVDFSVARLCRMTYGCADLSAQEQPALSIIPESLSHDKIDDMTEREAEELFVQIRWADNGGEPCCPYCPGPTKIYVCRRPHPEAKRSGASRYRCKNCRRDFSATSGDRLFAWHKMSFKKMLRAILAFVNEVKGKATLAMTREVDASYKAHFVFEHKLRAAMWRETAHLRVGDPGVGGPNSYVQIDGVHISRSYRKPNKRGLAIEKVLKDHAKNNSRWIVAIRQRPRKHSADKRATIIGVFAKQKDAVPWIVSRVIPNTVVHTDADGDWVDLRGIFRRRVVNHNKMFWVSGVSTNTCEELFTRFRRGVHGHYHRVIGGYFDKRGRHITDHLARYGQEFAWRDDHSGEKNGQQVERLIRLMMQTPRSLGAFCGYWQQYRRTETNEVLPESIRGSFAPEPPCGSSKLTEPFDLIPVL
jgi:transposase-like protein